MRFDYNSIEHTLLQEYLKNHGWIQLNAGWRGVELFEKDDKEIKLPKSRTINDYETLIKRAIHDFSEFEDKEVKSVITDLILPPGDLVRLRIQNDISKSGSIPFLKGAKYLDLLKNAFFISAIDILRPGEQYHRRLQSTHADMFVNSIILEQSEAGSYVVPLLIPFADLEGKQLSEQKTLFSSPKDLEDSFSRSVTKQLVKSFNTLSNIIESEGSNILEKSSSEYGFSSNFVQIVADMTRIDQQTIFELKPNFYFKSPIKEFDNTSIRFESDCSDLLAEWADRLRPSTEEERGTYYGKIKNLSSEPDISDRQGGDATFVFMSKDEKIINASISLDTEQHNAAIEAYKHGKTIKIVGTLIVKRKSASINVEMFEVQD